MRVGYQVRVWPRDRPELVASGYVIALAEHGNSIAITLLPSEQHLYAHRDGENAPWINLETNEPIEIL